MLSVLTFLTEALHMIVVKRVPVGVLSGLLLRSQPDIMLHDKQPRQDPQSDLRK